MLENLLKSHKAKLQIHDLRCMTFKKLHAPASHPGYDRNPDKYKPAYFLLQNNCGISIHPWLSTLSVLRRVPHGEQNRPRATSEATHTGMSRHTTVKRGKLRSRRGSRRCQSPAAKSTSHFCQHCVYFGQKRNRNSHSDDGLVNFMSA